MRERQRHTGRRVESKARALDRGPAAKGRVSAGEVAGLDLSTDEGCRRLVCAGFCTFFKPVPATDDHCGGLSEVERRLAAASADPETLARLRAAAAALLGSEAPVSYRFDAELYQAICRACPFVSGGDCEHRDSDVDPQARLEPCGGYILLAALAEAGVLTPGGP